MDYFDSVRGSARLRARLRSATDDSRRYYLGGTYRFPAAYPAWVLEAKSAEGRDRRMASDDNDVANFMAAIETILSWPYDEKGVVRDATP